VSKQRVSLLKIRPVPAEAVSALRVLGYLRNFFLCLWELGRLCGPVVRVPGYRSTGPWFDSRVLPDFLRTSGSGTGYTQPPEDNEELLEWKSSGSGLENRD
jgi:hypothetical protein